jgi:hypothetical protein
MEPRGNGLGAQVGRGRKRRGRSKELATIHAHTHFYHVRAKTAALPMNGAVRADLVTSGADVVA